MLYKESYRDTWSKAQENPGAPSLGTAGAGGLEHSTQVDPTPSGFHLNQPTFGIGREEKKDTAICRLVNWLVHTLATSMSNLLWGLLANSYSLHPLFQSP